MTELQAAVSKLTSLKSEYDRAISNLNLQTEKLDQWKPEIEKGQAAFQDSMWRQHDAYIENQIAPYQAKLKALSEQQAAILAEANVKLPDQLPPGSLAVEYANISVDAARVRLDMANVEFKAREFALANLPLFQQTAEQKSFIETRQKYEELESEVSRLKMDVSAYKPKFHDAASVYYSRSKTVLNSADFLYFSFGAATTATFGDIAPNHWGVRLLVCIQVFISIMVLNRLITVWSGGNR